MDVNGTLRSFAPADSEYIGVDLQSGPGVDVVLPNPVWFPFNMEFDLIVSTSCFEHDPMFWVTFKEMIKVLKPGGFIYLSAPSNGPYHGYPGDCWRFYPDAAKALETWSYLCGYPVTLVETFLVPPRRDIWTDNVMIFGKPPVPTRPKVLETIHANS